MASLSRRRDGGGTVLGGGTVPTEIRDVFGNVTKLCYNILNVPVKVIDANGIVTEYEYNADGRVSAFDRDAFGRVLKEKFA